MRAQTNSVNSGCAPNQQPSLFVAAISNGRDWLTRFFNTLFLAFATTRVLHFFSQENFFAEIENKIHFFLVAFATDF